MAFASASSSSAARSAFTTVATAAVTASVSLLLAKQFLQRKQQRNIKSASRNNNDAITKGGYESLIGNTPILYLPHLSSLINKFIENHRLLNSGENNNADPTKSEQKQVKIFVKMENMNPGGTGKDRAARSMLRAAEQRGELPPSLNSSSESDNFDSCGINTVVNETGIESSNCGRSGTKNKEEDNSTTDDKSPSISTIQSSEFLNIDPSIHKAILTALRATKTHGIVIEGTSGSTGISLASLASPRGHGVIVVLPDDQSTQKSEFLKRLGCGVVVVKNCSISNPGHYVNVARRVWELVQTERRYDDYYWKNIVCRRNCNHSDANIVESKPPKQLLKAAFMNQFENLANVLSHYTTTGPEIYSQLEGKVDAFVMSAGTGGTLVGVGGFLKERWWHDCCRNQQPSITNSQTSTCQQHTTLQTSSQNLKQSPPKIVLVDPPGSSLFNKIKHGVAYAPQQSERTLRRHRYDTLAEGIGLDRITANFGLGCESIVWKNVASTNGTGNGSRGSFGQKIEMQLDGDNDVNGGSNHHQPSSSVTPEYQSKIVDDAINITDQQAIYMAHYLLRHEGLFVGSSTAMNIAGALIVAADMPVGSNVVTVVCDGGQRHTSRFWNRDFVVGEWGLDWPGDNDDPEKGENILGLLGILPCKT